MKKVLIVFFVLFNFVLFGCSGDKNAENTTTEEPIVEETTVVVESTEPESGEDNYNVNEVFGKVRDEQEEKLGKVIEIITDSREEFKKGKYDEAFKLIEDALKIDDSFAIIYARRADYLYKREILNDDMNLVSNNNVLKALEDINKAIQIDEDNGIETKEFYLIRAEINSLLKNFDASLDDLNKAKTIKDSNIEYERYIYYLFASVYLEKGEFDAALENIDKAINLSSDMKGMDLFHLKYKKAEILAKAGKKDDALKLLDELNGFSNKSTELLGRLESELKK